MRFDPTAYGPAVAGILALDGNGERLMPLANGKCASQAARAALRGTTAAALFPNARAPEAALAGLYLYFSCWEEAHTIAQDIATPDGSYWHAIVHRQEPDPGNSAYWFRRVGAHPIFPALQEAAAALGVSFGSRWDPFAFIDYCENSNNEGRALKVQRAEWQLLFDYCGAGLRPADGT